MNAELRLFEERLLAISPPTIAPGQHMLLLHEKLLALAGRRRNARPRHWRTILVIGALTTTLAAASGYKLWLSRIERRFVWSGFEEVPAAYRAEVAEKWKSGHGVLVKKLPQSNDRPSTYLVRFNLSDGQSLLVRAGRPPVPARWREIEVLREAGRGETVGHFRDEAGGAIWFVNRYRLSDGDDFQMLDDLPVLSPTARAAVDFELERQQDNGLGEIVGRRPEGQYVVQYDLPDGYSVTLICEEPPGLPRAEREAQIALQRSRGEGRLVEVLISDELIVYTVEYCLSHGLPSRVGESRPPMSDEAWNQARAAAQTLYQAGKFTRHQVTGLGGQPVTILEFEVAGSTARVVDSPVSRSIWGLE